MKHILSEKRYLNLLYEQFKTELEVCKIGGLFIALYNNPKVPELIINLFKNDEDLKNYFQFPLYIDERKISFPTLFDYTFQSINQQDHLFHVLGIEENLSSKSTKQFLEHLQYSRERFKAKPYSLIFWVTPEFEKELFYQAPDFHHWVFGTYDFTNINDKEINSLTETLKKESFDSTKIDEYLQKAIIQYKNWQRAKDNKETFLLEPMERNDLCKYYVQSYCLDLENNRDLLDSFANNFLNNNQQKFLCILGDFGTGKSSFLIHYFIILAENYLRSRDSQNQDLEKSRIPMFISLKNYKGKLNIENFIVQEFYQKFNIELDYRVFQELAVEGKFIFLIDGFDEMASLTDEQLTIENLKELTKLSFENILFLTTSRNAHPVANKIILTSRTHYFLSETQEREILKADLTILYRNYATKSTYELTRVKLEEFNCAQIKEFIQKHTEDKAKTDQYLKIIESTYNLQDLSTRPLLLDMIIKTISTLKEKNNINTSALYQEYTNIWIERDDWRSKMTPEGKRSFMWDMAIKIYNTGGDFSIHYSQLSKPKPEHLKDNYQEHKDKDYYKYEITTCTFLNRDQEGNYKFIHKSFLEYFIAESFYSYLRKDNSRIIKYANCNQEIQEFFKNIISIHKLELNNIDLSRLNLKYANLEGANLNRANLEYANLKYANLEGANLNRANLKGANFSSPNLRNANLEGANLEYANLEGAYLEGAYLEGANLEYAHLEYAHLNRANLEGANIKGANLEGAYLEGANLYGADLRNANLNGANLNGADLNGADLSFANLGDANLEETSLNSSLLLATDFRQSKNLTTKQLQGKELHYLCNVKLPEYLNSTVIDINRDCEQLPKIISRRYQIPIESAHEIVNKARSTKWD